jgi:hypothetical protein
MFTRSLSSARLTEGRRGVDFQSLTNDWMSITFFKKRLNQIHDLISFIRISKNSAMNYQSETDRPYAIDVICPIGKGLRITLKNYSKSECDDVMHNLKIQREKFHLLVLIEMAKHEYMIYP